MATGLRRIDPTTRAVRIKDIYYEGVSYEHDTFATATPADTNLATILTLAAGEELLESEVICTNKSASAVTVRVGVGTGAAPASYLVYDLPILANLYVRVFIPGLGSLNKIFVRSSSANNVYFTVTGNKKTTV